MFTARKETHKQAKTCWELNRQQERWWFVGGEGGRENET